MKRATKSAARSVAMSRDSPMTHPTPADLVKELRADAENCRAEKDGGHMDDVLEAQAQRNEAIAAALSSTQVREKKLEAELVEARASSDWWRVETAKSEVALKAAESSLAAAKERVKELEGALDWLISGIETEIDVDRLTAKFKRRIKEARALQEG